MVPAGSDPVLPAGSSPSCANSGIPAPARPCSCPRAMLRRGAGALPLPPSPRRRAESRSPPPICEPPDPAHPAPPQDPAGSSTEGKKPYSPQSPPGARLTPPQPPLTSPPPPAPRGSRTQPAWCGVSPSSHPRPGHETIKPPWGNTVAPVVSGKGDQRDIGRVGGAQSTAHFSRLDCDLYSGLEATSSHACSSRQGEQPPRHVPTAQPSPAALLAPGPAPAWHGWLALRRYWCAHPHPGRDKKASGMGLECHGPVDWQGHQEQGWQLSRCPCPWTANLSRGRGSHGRIIPFPGAKPQLRGIIAGGYIKERGADGQQCSALEPSLLHTYPHSRAGDSSSPTWTKRCHPVSWLTNTVGMLGIVASFPAAEPGTEQGAFSARCWGRQRALGQGELLEPRSQDGAWDLGAGSHWAVTDGPTLQETAPATRLPPA